MLLVLGWVQWVVLEKFILKTSSTIPASEWYTSLKNTQKQHNNMWPISTIPMGMTNVRVVHSSELEAVLNDPTLNACVIATPTQTHEKLVLASLHAKESYIKALEHFFDVIEGKCEAERTKESTLLTSEIAEACERSLATGQAVTLPQ